MLELSIVFVCLVLNGILAASEIAFVSLNKRLLRQLEKTFPVKTRRLLALRAKPERTLSVIQLGITLLGLVSGAVSGTGVEESISPWLQVHLGLGPNSAEILGILLVVIPLTALMVIFGELVPKALALRHPFEIAAGASRWLLVLDRIFHPVISLFEWATKMAVRIWSMLLGGGRHQISATAADATEDQLTRHHEQYVLNMVALEAKCVRDIYCPWEAVVKIDWGNSMEKALSIAIDSGHTRLPVYRDGLVQGLLNTKELIAFASQGAEDWRLLLRPILRVKGEDSLIRILKMMQEKRSHLAVWDSASGAPLGIVTLEDILEEIVGDVADEDDDRLVARLMAQRARLKKDSFHGSPGP